jgi:formylglycine-generating enzyme required for sulfatase activity
MLRFILKSLQTLLVITGAILLSTLAINAADSLKNPSSSLLAGALSGITKTSACPSGMVSVGAPKGEYCIDAYEASAGAACAFRDPGNQNETRANIDFASCTPVSEKGAVPWRNISQDQAAVACAKAGKRLPTNEEWFFAALGTPDPAENFGSADCNVNKNWGQYDPGKTGSGAACVSPLGAYDMIGNVWEWVGETAKEGKYGDSPLPDAGYVKGADEKGIPSETGADPDDNYHRDRFWLTKEGTRGMFRGGFFGSGADAGLYTLHAEMPPSFIGTAIGFRCVK